MSNRQINSFIIPIMSDTEKIPSGTLTKADIESIKRVVYSCGDDIAVSISRSFERLEERIDAGEARLSTRLGDFSEEIARTGNLVSELNDNHKTHERASV